jgi:4-hydroxy-2-oxoheptanedioate aldolase
MLDAIVPFREKLKAGKPCFGVSITLTDPLVTDALAELVDYLWLDLEHSLMSPEAVAGHLLASRSRNVPTLVRVPAGQTPFIKPVLDAGAHGIIVPQIKTVAEVRQAVADCHYPPLGQRGFGPRVPSNYSRMSNQEYIAYANERVFTSVQIETKEALAAIDEIVAVPGLDSVVIGPMDLSGSLGFLGQMNHPQLETAIDTIIAKARAAGLSIGIGMGGDPDFAAKMIRRGVQWLQVGSDYSYMIQGIVTVRTALEARLAAKP